MTGEQLFGIVLVMEQTKPMTARKQTAIVADLRSQILDVRLGIITAAEWRTRVAKAVALGVEIPKDWK